MTVNDMHPKKYNVLDDISLPSGDRICFYFGFNPTLRVGYAAKKLSNNKTSHIKSFDLAEVIAWLGFDELAHTLLTSPNFNTKYKTYYKDIKENLKCLIVNSRAIFFFKQNNVWSWCSSPDDLVAPCGEGVNSLIDSIMGQNFCNQVNSKILQDKKLDESFSETASNLRNLNDKIMKGEICNNAGNSDVPIIDINETTSAVN